MPPVSAASWVKFFTTAGIPSQAAAGYAHVFVENRIQMDMLMDLNKEYLREMGITTMGDIIAILRHSKQVNEQFTRERVLSSPSAGGGEDHSPTVPVPVATVSATQSSAPKSVISRPSSAVLLPPSKTRKLFSDHKITLPGGSQNGSSTTSSSRGGNSSSNNNSSSGSIKKSQPQLMGAQKSNVFKRLSSHNSDEELEAEPVRMVRQRSFDDDEDMMEARRTSSGKPASKVALKGIERLAPAGDRNSASIFSRLGGKSLKRDSDGPTGILKKSPAKIVSSQRKITPTSQKVILVKKIPAKAVAVRDDDDEDASNSRRDKVHPRSRSLPSQSRRSYERMDTGETLKSVSFSEEDEVLEIDPHPDEMSSPYKPPAGKVNPRPRFHNRDVPVRARLGNHSPNRKPQISALRGTKRTVPMKVGKHLAGNTTTLSPASLARSKMKSDAMLLSKDQTVRNRLGFGGMRLSPPRPLKTNPVHRHPEKRLSLDSKLASLKLKGTGSRPHAGRKMSAGSSVFDRLGYNSRKN
ncbi:uncharacterized protein C19orf47 [Uranotaenia lowii]|uniref:uncharacterized protein C19orf47 n=1 Tax=Uranotaenia lowii TaxID=190385 RepID=UPI00247B1FEE|nr:uncharacterized protein C19orf47 [Uranotaenia lowii]